MAFDKEIDNIRASANIVDVISSYLPLTQRGKNYFGVCPFHEDHSPSMSVSTEKQIYKCFSCGASGNVFTFVKDYENVSFMEAVKIVADKCGINFIAKSAPVKTMNNNYKKEYEIMDLALKFYQNNLNTELGNAAKQYLLDRKLTETTIKEFDLGLALDKEYSLNKLLLNKKYEIEDLLELGLINRNGEYINDTFKNRIIFPIHNLEGNVIGFTGRIYEKSDQAKYMNSKESKIFKKGQILFNYHRAKNEIKKKKEVIIVEGNMDAIRMYTSGIKNVIALMGTSLTKDQVEIIKNLRAKVILMFDNDDAGEIATYANGNILASAGIEPFIVRLSGEKDPDEYIIKNGVDAILTNIRSPISFLDFKLKYLRKNKDLKNTNDLVEYIKEMINSIKDIPDELTKELTMRKISEEQDIPLDLLKRELDKVGKPEKKQEKKEIPLEKKVLSKYDKASRTILFYMMNSGLYIERFKKEMGFFENKIYRGISNEIIYYYERNKQIDFADFLSFIETKEYLRDEIMEIIKNTHVEEMNMDNFMEMIETANKEVTKEKIKELKREIANELDVSKQLELAKKLNELKKGCVENEKN